MGTPAASTSTPSMNDAAIVARYFIDSSLDLSVDSALLLLCCLYCCSRSARHAGLLERHTSLLVFLHGHFVARVPVLEMTRLARVVEVPAGIEERFDIPLLHNLEHLQADVSQGLDFGIPQDPVSVDLRLDLGGR